jgi:glycerol-3-phosphate acyltransferase PlsY
VIFLPDIFPSLLSPELSEMIFSIATAVFIPVTHLKNIKRLLKGEEKKLFGKKRERPKKKEVHS